MSQNRDSRGPWKRPRHTAGRTSGTNRAAGRDRQEVVPRQIPLPQATVEFYERASARRGEEHPHYALARFVRWPEDWLKGPAIKKAAYKRALESLRHVERMKIARLLINRRASWLALAEKQSLARRLMLIARTPFVLHLSSRSPVELGMALHHLYGFPVIPATSLKGLMCANCPEQEQGIYGELQQVGRIAILDGIPLQYEVVPDIMTPHAREWYEGRKPAPDDSESPVPIQFLTVAQGAKFEIALIARNPETAGQDIELATRHLRHALDWFGLGAKTSAGYGAMDVEVLPSTIAHGRSETGAEVCVENGMQRPDFIEKMRQIEALPPNPAGQIGAFVSWCLGLSDPMEQRQAAAAIQNKMGAKYIRDKAKSKDDWRQIQKTLEQEDA